MCRDHFTTAHLLLIVPVKEIRKSVNINFGEDIEESTMFLFLIYDSAYRTKVAGD